MHNSNRSLKPKKLGRKPVEMQFDFKVEFVPIAEDKQAAINAGNIWLLHILRDLRDELKQEADVSK